MKKKRLELNVRFNQNEWKMLRKLKEKYAINISAAIKIFLGQKLQQMENWDGKP